MDTCKFKVGDHVVVKASNIEELEKCAGRTGVIMDYDTRGSYPYLVKIDGSPLLRVWCKVKCLVKEANGEKIVITHDGKTTTATKYCEDGSEVTATTRCAPEDKFDFNVGAKLAMERLVEKVSHIEWRVVNRKAVVGDYIRLRNHGGYRWNKPGDILRVDQVTHGSCVSVLGKNHPRVTDDQDYYWSYIGGEYEVVEKVTGSELPKYYNGKVVCINNGRVPEDLTVGKIYTFVNGNCENNHGGKILSTPCKDIDDLNRRWFSNVKFIPLVE